MSEYRYFDTKNRCHDLAITIGKADTRPAFDPHKYIGGIKKCPKCGSKQFIEKFSRHGHVYSGRFYKCANANCNFTCAWKRLAYCREKTALVDT